MYKMIFLLAFKQLDFFLSNVQLQMLILCLIVPSKAVDKKFKAT
jgi:hypothetical protein